jgi:hypothetical protein
MDPDEQRAEDASRLLRALVTQAMAEKGHEHLEAAVGVTVVPNTATERSARMEVGTPRYNAARDTLLEMMALERDDETDLLLGNISEVPEAFKITQIGIDLLRDTGTL